jgi:hypothetical protein
MSAQTAAESLILEFVRSPDFQTNLHEFMQGGSVRSENLIGILRQYVNSPTCDAAHRNFWNSPMKRGPESQFEESDNTLPRGFYEHQEDDRSGQ